MTKQTPFKILSAVTFNKGEAYVLNRAPTFKYAREGNNLIGRDGPFVDLYYHEKPTKRFEAFAGREFDIPMLDGTVVRASGQWWRGHVKDAPSITYNTNEGLLNCYVYYGAQVDADALSSLRDEYTGFVYPYHDYETILNKDKQWKAICERDQIISTLKKQLSRNHRVSVDLMAQLARNKGFPEWRLKRFAGARS